MLRRLQTGRFGGVANQHTISYRCVENLSSSNRILCAIEAYYRVLYKPSPPVWKNEFLSRHDDLRHAFIPSHLADRRIFILTKTYRQGGWQLIAMVSGTAPWLPTKRDRHPTWPRLSSRHHFCPPPPCPTSRQLPELPLGSQYVVTPSSQEALGILRRSPAGLS